jgi:SLOG family YspA-like protein
MRVLICGGRNFDDVTFAHQTLDRLHREHNFRTVIEGGARGADTIGGEWG